MRLRHLSAALLAVLLILPASAQTRFGAAPAPGFFAERAERLAQSRLGGDALETFSGIPLGTNEVPANASPARGYSVAEFNRTTRELSVFTVVDGLTGTYLFSHVHEGAAGTNGPVILNETFVGPLVDGYRQIEIVGTLTETQVASLDAGNLYVNVHSSAFPGGEVRAQLVETTTLEEARALGAGTVITAIGYVQRARGAFTYFTDDTGGLTVRQTSGAWRDAVNAGTIRSGTVVQVTGTLSQFRELLQINQANATTNDLTSFARGPEVPFNANQSALFGGIVSLADVAAFGEDLEGTLVFVPDVTLAGGAGGTFGPGTNVPATDDSTPANPVVVRVPSAADTDVDGLTIPTVPVGVLAIVGQFSTTTPDVGYQLLVIDANDIDPKASVQVVHNAADPALALVDIATNGVVAFDNVAFRSATPTVQLAAFELIDLEVFDSASGTSLFTGFGLLVADDGRTGQTILAAQGVADPTQFAANPDGVSTAFDIFAYPAARLVAGQASVRVVHGATDAPTVDVRVGSTVLADDVTYSDFSGFAAPAGPYQLDITTADGSVVAAQFDVTLAGLADVRVATFASGFLNPEANQNGPGFALLTTLADGSAFVIEPNTVSADGAPAGDVLAVRAVANPVRSGTDIAVALPEAGVARLAVYDVLGREVAVLLDGERAAGTHTARFDAGRVAPGVYTLRLTAGGQAAATRITVVR